MPTKEKTQADSENEYREDSKSSDEAQEKKATKANADDGEKKMTSKKQARGKSNKNAKEEEESEDSEGVSDGESEDEDAGDSDDGSGSDNKESGDDFGSDQETGQKRKQPDVSRSPSKKQKTSGSKNNDTHGSKHDKAEEPFPKGSNERLPKKGQCVAWKAMPGWVYGKVLEVVTEDKEMQGKHIKASKDNPRLALEAESGKFCVHKPDNCYFDDNE